MSALADGWAEASALGLLDTDACDLAEPPEPTPSPPSAEPRTAEQFHALRRTEHRAKLRRKIEQLRPTSTMNDRAAPARKAARLVQGGDGSGGEGDVADGATCAHHAVANIGEEGRKAIDKGLKAKMNITDEQAESDAAKLKCLRTSVGWFSSPACSLIYQVCCLPGKCIV